eukprot:TRINITY_DN94749_c0_g1_i1.p1 TRINITY_DN94749_c0_g1~~TRINITY_DN94749_c0_g1_i1.p1  ORF type:complete len:100 (-),score=3.25 TRINITY_DN94749_c0_g1_i1:65-364(-)
MKTSLVLCVLLTAYVVEAFQELTSSDGFGLKEPQSGLANSLPASLRFLVPWLPGPIAQTVFRYICWAVLVIVGTMFVVARVTHGCTMATLYWAARPSPY